ncbi:MAG: transglycosylase SLT domain-containing protein [Muribaculaceae bacterium]
MKRKDLILSLCMALASGAAASAAPAMSVLAMQDTLHTQPIVMPESFEADTKLMQDDWYLKNYAVIDTKADAVPDVPVSDEVIIERLQAMPTIIEMPFNSIVKKYIEAYTGKHRQLVENMLGLSLYYMPIFEEALDRHGLPWELKYLPIVESALNPAAVSRAGATGLWQFMPATASGEGLEINSLIDQRRDPYASSEAAACYLKKLYGIYNDWSLAIAAYNCGPGNVNKAIRRAGNAEKKDFWSVYPYLPRETQGYFPAFVAVNYVMTYYAEHRISPALARKPIAVDSVHVSRRVHFQQISDVMNIPMDELRVLNPQYRADFIPGDIKPYPLVLPSLQAYAYVVNEDSIVNHNADLYARREVVEPATASSVSGRNGEYVEELIVKWHTVKRGETLSKIAKKYGVSQSSIRKANKIGKKVKRGQKLKINTYQRRFIETPDTTALNPEQPINEAPIVEAPAAVENDADAAPADTAAAVSDENRAVAEAMKSAENKAKAKAEQAGKEKSSKQQAKKAKNAEKKQKTTNHTVKKGENLFKIAKKYGVTVDDIKKANNIKGDNIKQGQKLKIPKK